MLSKIKRLLIEFIPYAIVIFLFGSCTAVCVHLNKPPTGGVPGTWTVPVSSPFQVDGRTCQSFTVEEGWMVNGKPTDSTSLTVGRFVKCDDKVMNMEVPGKGGYH